MVPRSRAAQGAEWWISMTTGTLALLGSAVATLGWLAKAPVMVVLACSASLVGGAVGLGVALVIVRKRPPNGYRIVSIDQCYEMLETETRVQRQLTRITIEATRSGVFLFSDRTRWSGAKKPKFSAPVRGQELWEIPFEVEGWFAYVIALRQPLVKGERTDLYFQAEYHSVSDDEQQWTGKTLSTRIVDSLTLRLQMGASLPSPDRFRADVLPPGTGDREVTKRLHVKHDAARGQASVTIKRPRPGMNYRLTVDFKHPSRPEKIIDMPVGRTWASGTGTLG